jgi:anti-sigma28 factor (negative regulator of flagellin synthesis)
MAIKNVTSSPAGNSPISKANENEKAGANAVAGIGSPASVAQAAQNINQANKNFGVELSEKGKARAAERKKAFDIAKATPDVREDKARLAAGTYDVDSGKIADGMLREALMEHLATSKDN